MTRTALDFLPGGTEAAHRLRDAPTADFVEHVRRAYPTEQEYDRLLTRKLLRRGDGPYRLVGIEELGRCLRAFLSDHVEGRFEVTDERWLAGGASKIQLAFTLDWDEPGVGRTRSSLVVRMEPAESLNVTSRRREFQLLTAMADTIPVPRTYWLDAEGRWFPEPAIVYAYVPGTTKPSAVTDARVSGTGTRFSPALRAELGAQFVEHLGAIHAHRWATDDLTAFDLPEAGTTQSPWWQLNRVRRIWEEDRGEDLPVVELVGNWLEEHMPVVDEVSVLHGDFRTGNFLFDEAGARITAWLDWERGHLGDRHRDLAWVITRPFGNLAEDGSFLISGLVGEDGFLEAYERASGLSVDPARLRYYQIFNGYQLVVSCLGSAYRVARLGKSHQDVVLTWIEGIVHPLAYDMLRILEGER